MHMHISIWFLGFLYSVLLKFSEKYFPNLNAWSDKGSQFLNVQACSLSTYLYILLQSKYCSCFSLSYSKTYQLPIQRVEFCSPSFTNLWLAIWWHANWNYSTLLSFSKTLWSLRIIYMIGSHTESVKAYNWLKPTSCLRKAVKQPPYLCRF